MLDKKNLLYIGRTTDNIIIFWCICISFVGAVIVKIFKPWIKENVADIVAIPICIIIIIAFILSNIFAKKGYINIDENNNLIFSIENKNGIEVVETYNNDEIIKIDLIKNAFILYLKNAEKIEINLYTFFIPDNFCIFARMTKLKAFFFHNYPDKVPDKWKKDKAVIKYLSTGQVFKYSELLILIATFLIMIIICAVMVYYP